MTVSNQDVVAARLCYWHRTAWNKHLRRGMYPLVTTDINQLEPELAEEYSRVAGSIIAAGGDFEAFAQLAGLPDEGPERERCRVVLKWARIPTPREVELGKAELNLARAAWQKQLLEGEIQ